MRRGSIEMAMGYWAYYAMWIFAALAMSHPLLLVGVLVFWLLRRSIPDPWVWLRTAGKIRTLKTQIEANPANTLARRDLADIYVQRMRPRTAAKLLEEALARRPDDAELLFLMGLARYRSGRFEEALDPLIRSVESDPAVRFGQAYMVAGDALMELGRHEEAEDAYERYTEGNSSSIEGLYKLSRAARKRRDEEGAKRALKEAVKTFSILPRFQRRKQLGWWLRAKLASLFA